MKLIGNYTSPYVRKISIILLEKNLPFTLVDDNSREGKSMTEKYNLPGNVPVLIDNEAACWFYSPVITGYLETLNFSPELLPYEPLAALRIRQIEALVEDVMDAALASVSEQQREIEQQSQTELLRLRQQIASALDKLEQWVVEDNIIAAPLNVASIATGCAIGYLNFRHVAPGWCVNRPALVALIDTLFQRESFARTQPASA